MWHLIWRTLSSLILNCQELILIKARLVRIYLGRLDKQRTTLKWLVNFNKNKTDVLKDKKEVLKNQALLC